MMISQSRHSLLKYFFQRNVYEGIKFFKLTNFWHEGKYFAYKSLFIILTNFDILSNWGQTLQLLFWRKLEKGNKTWGIEINSPILSSYVFKWWNMGLKKSFFSIRTSDNFFVLENFLLHQPLRRLDNNQQW